MSIDQNKYKLINLNRCHAISIEYIAYNNRDMVIDITKEKLRNEIAESIIDEFITFEEKEYTLNLLIDCYVIDKDDFHKIIQEEALKMNLYYQNAQNVDETEKKNKILDFKNNFINKQKNPYMEEYKKEESKNEE